MNSHTTRILITSGATLEPLDDVRYLGNRSSGKLGTLLAYAAACTGYEVTLLSGAQSIQPTAHPRLTAIPFSTARDLRAKLVEHWPSHSILIMAAAVADFTPVGGQSHGKFMRDDALTITYTQTEDIVAELASTSREDQRVIAFALEESAHLEERGRAKLLRKKVDAIVANPLETMDSNEIDAVILKKDGSSVSLDGITTKAEFAHWLILHLEEILPTT